MSKYNRENFLQTNEVDYIIEKDLVMLNFDLFKIKRPTVFYKVKYADLKRPDLLSLKLYQKMDYWWIIGKVNNIDDWWNDLKEDDIIKIPDLLDIEDFYLQVKNVGNNG